MNTWSLGHRFIWNIKCPCVITTNKNAKKCSSFRWNDFSSITFTQSVKTAHAMIDDKISFLFQRPIANDIWVIQTLITKSLRTSPGKLDTRLFPSFYSLLDISFNILPLSHPQACWGKCARMLQQMTRSGHSKRKWSFTNVYVITTGRYMEG